MPDRLFRVMNIVGARPNMMKMAPLVAAMASSSSMEPVLVHTGQHYDYDLSQVFFEQLGMPQPDYNLEVGSGTHHGQTAAVMERFGKLVQEDRPDLIVVAGDVNSTMACALVGAKEQIPVAHVEAGLRSFDRSMPEEVNRIVTDSISTLLFTTEEAANQNLEREGIPRERIHFVGNIMIDSLAGAIDAARRSPLKVRMDLQPQSYIVLTLHRPANVDDPQRLIETLDAIAAIAEDLPVVFPVHPRTKAKIEMSGFSGVRDWQPGMAMSGVVMIPPASYFDFIGLVADAALVITDSGGLQEETTYLGVDCLTFRDNTERPITVAHGTNRLIGTDPRVLVREARVTLRDSHQTRNAGRSVPPLWDGKTAARIVSQLQEYLCKPQHALPSKMSHSY
jgi:UDP-N-acetylglucosamine 2-epimerase (non-hydrolysing)